MNILPHKSWHVRTKKNIERVRVDEAKAAEEEKERLQRIAIAEQESRTDILRQRARKRKRSDTDDNQVELATCSSSGHQVELASSSGHQVELTNSSAHINFFQDEEAGKKIGGTNKEYEDEKKAEKEKEEKRIGLLTYLGQSAIESQTSKPWFMEPRKDPPKRQKTDLPEEKPKKYIDEEFELKKKLSMDPMARMTTYLNHKKKRGKNKDKGKEKEHKYKHRHKHRDKARDRSSSSGSKTIEQLRAERLRREKEEREKTEKLFARMRGEKEAEPKDLVEVDDRKRRYNSQFNPDLARKPKAKDNDVF